MSRYSEDLPSWFVRPQSCEPSQRSLLTTGTGWELAGLGISSADVRSWQERGWIGEPPAEGTAFHVDEDPALFQFILVRDLTRAGLSDAQISDFLADLPRPLSFDPRSIAFSFRYGWVEPANPPTIREVIDENVLEWLEDCADDGEFKRLEQIATRIIQLLAQRADEEPRTPD